MIGDGTMWHVHWPDGKQQTFPTREEAEHRAREVAEEEGRELKIEEP